MNNRHLLRRFVSLANFFIALIFISGCATAPRPGTHVKRTGDEIVVAGQMFHAGTRVVLWTEPGGYDAYRVERRFAPFGKSDWETSRKEVEFLKTPNRYGLRQTAPTNGQPVLSDEEVERVRGGGWDLPTLQRVVDQFVIHFDECGTSKQCFNILQDHRDLSVHFMCDIDGTIYQTLDLKERAWHATTSNTRSVGIEVANIGYGSGSDPLTNWYSKDDTGKLRITLPKKWGDGGVRTKNFIGRPARQELIRGTIQGHDVSQYDYTPEQYAALIKLTATLCKVFPKITCDYPKDAGGKLIPKKLDQADLEKYHGVLGHYHIQTNKTDPGPAMQWDHLIGGARRILNNGMSKAANETSAGHMRASVSP